MGIKQTGDFIHGKVLRFLEDHEGVTYGEGLRRVLKDDTRLASEYLGCDAVKPSTSGSATVRLQQRAGEELDKLARLYMQQHGERDYAHALQIVLHENKELAEVYCCE